MAPRDRRLVTAVTLPMLAAYRYRIGRRALEGRAPARACLARTRSQRGAAGAAPSSAAGQTRAMTVPAIEVIPARRWAIDIPAEQRGSALLLIGRGVQLVNGLLLSIVLVQRFGLATVGAFALGIAAVNILATVCALGLGAYLPRQQQSHGQSCFAALVLFLAQLPLVVPLLAALRGVAGARPRASGK